MFLYDDIFSVVLTTGTVFTIAAFLIYPIHGRTAI